LKRNKGSKRQINSSVEPFSEAPKLTDDMLQELAHKYEGKLLLKEEISLPHPLFTFLIAKNYFSPTQTISFSHGGRYCVRCHNRKKFLFGSIPCSRCGKTHLYCRNCLEMGRILACQSLYFWTGSQYHWPKITNACTWQGELTREQRYGANKIAFTMAHNQKLLVWAVTGAGKTEMLFPGLTKALAQGKRICIASPRADVVRELVPRLRLAFQTVSIEGLYSGSADKSGTAQILVATTHQLLRYRHAFDVLIIDEIDAFPYHQDKSLQFAAKGSIKKIASMIYLTATPREKQRLQMAMNKLDHVFVPVRFHGHPLIVPKWIQCNHLQKNLRKNKFPTAFLQWIRLGQPHSERQLLIFIPTIKEVTRLLVPIRDMLLDEKIITSPEQIDHVHAEDEQRREKVIAFRKKVLKVLLTTTILERGVTFPSVNVVVLHAGHEVFDEAALVQIAGRVGRSTKDPNGEILFFHDGKTDAMVGANRAIKEMNQRAKKGGIWGKGED
jgi:competence protein ComFA